MNKENTEEHNKFSKEVLNKVIDLNWENVAGKIIKVYDRIYEKI